LGIQPLIVRATIHIWCIGLRRTNLVFPLSWFVFVCRHARGCPIISNVSRRLHQTTLDRRLEVTVHGVSLWAWLGFSPRFRVCADPPCERQAVWQRNPRSEAIGHGLPPRMVPLVMLVLRSSQPRKSSRAQRGWTSLAESLPVLGAGTSMH